MKLYNQILFSSLLAVSVVLQAHTRFFTRSQDQRIAGDERVMVNTDLSP